MIKSSDEYLKNLLENKVVDLNNPNCSNCNECCALTTMISKKEYLFYKKFFKSNKGKEIYKEAIERHIKIAKEKKAVNFMCPFSTKTKRCSIYSIRPTVCREFHCKSNLNKLNKENYEYMEKYSMFDLFFEKNKE